MVSFDDMVANAPIPHHCRTCSAGLNLVIIVDAGTNVHKNWRHVFPADHPPDPVPDVEMPGTELEGVCDFCSAPNPRWGYKADNFASPAGFDVPSGTEFAYGSAGGWAACDTCADLIDADDFDALLRRALDHINATRPPLPPELDAGRRIHLSSIYAQFRATKSSGRLPVEEA